MKKPFLRTIIASSGRECVLIILFQLYGSKARVGQYDPLNLHIGRKINPMLI